MRSDGNDDEHEAAGSEQKSTSSRVLATDFAESEMMRSLDEAGRRGRSYSLLDDRPDCDQAYKAEEARSKQPIATSVLNVVGFLSWTRCEKRLPKSQRWCAAMVCFKARLFDYRCCG